MKREDLTKLGLTDDAVIDAIMTAHGKDIEKHKTDLAAAQEQVKTLGDQLKEAGTTIEGFKAMKPDELKAAADEWKAKAEQAAKDAADQIDALRFDVTLKESLKEFKVKDPADVIPHLNRDMLKLGDDGKLIGLKEQVEPLKASKDYLFQSETPEHRVVLGGNNQTVITDAVVDAARKAAGIAAPATTK